jgi:hypothetical protein
MDVRAKRRHAEAVRKHFSSRIQPLGFARTKPTFWTRATSRVAQFVHLHLFMFGPIFRVHFGIRVFNDVTTSLRLHLSTGRAVTTARPGADQPQRHPLGPASSRKSYCLGDSGYAGEGARFPPATQGESTS